MAFKRSPRKEEEDDDDRTQLPTPLQSPSLVRHNRSPSASSSNTLVPQPFPLETHAPSPSSDVEDADPLEYVLETDEDDEDGYTTAPPPISEATTTTFSTIDSGALYHMRYRYGERTASTPTRRRTSSRANKLCRRCGHTHRSHRHCRTVSVIHERGFSELHVGPSVL